MLLVEHDMPLVTSVADELIALETGRVIARGTPKQVTNDHRVIEAYLGTDERVVTRSGAAKKAKASRNGAAKRKPKAKAPARKTAPARKR
jgi:ABC-type hemin transport system ATPase subunit